MTVPSEPPIIGPQEDGHLPAPALGPVPMEPVPPPQRRGRAGRDLVAAVSVGVGLAVVVVVSLYVDRVAFVCVVSAAAVLAVLELANAFAAADIRMPLPPVLLAAFVLPFVALYGDDGALLVAVGVSALAVLAWRAVRDPRARARAGEDAALFSSDVTAGIFTLLYVPFLACFAVLMVRPDDGAARVVTFVLLTVLSDVGGFVAGVLFGRHPMAASISPKKSWEGFVGSALLSGAGGAVIVTYLTWGTPLQGAAVGLAVMLAATLGDLGESMIKRDLGVKDMGNLLPGHGGVMDRLDSLLPAAPVAYLLLVWLAPA